MIEEDKIIVIDMDSTLCEEKPAGIDYADVQPNHKVVEILRKYRDQGFYIIIDTARNMRTYQGNIGKINKNTLPVIIDWLRMHGIPYDEIHTGKPWCGRNGFYVDDRTIRPSEFTTLSYHEIMRVTGREKS